MSPDKATHRTHQFIYKTEAVSENGMVTAMHPLAAEAGVEVLRDAGGNATDAAIATALVLGVVEPFMSGLGGAAYAVAYDAATRTTRSFDGSVAIPIAAREDMFELVGEDVPRLGLYGWPATRDDAAETGYLSVAVPSGVAALERLHAFSGTLPWRELVAPALRLAKEGFPVEEYLFAQSASSESRLRAFPETLAVFYHPDGTSRVPSFHGQEPERLRQPQLAQTLELLAREGPSSFYRGAAAEEIVSFVRGRGGILSAEDLRIYEPREAPPARVRYRGRSVELLPGASGGTTVAMALALLEGFALDELGQDDPERLHLVAEALRLAFADRFRFMADAESELVPLEGLLAPAYVAERRESLDRELARAVGTPLGDPWRHQGEPRPESTPGGGDSPGQHTTHLNAVDRAHNMVALTATLGARYGSGVTVPSLGVVLNNGMMWFDPVPGRLNSIRPGKRALHAAAPCLVLDEGRPVLALGSPGARRIMSAVLQVLLHATDQRMGIQEAIAAPRLHCEAEGPLQVDTRFAPEVLESLATLGHPVEGKTETFLSSYFGRPSGVLIDLADGTLRGGVEPYRVSAAVGF